MDIIQMVFLYLYIVGRRNLKESPEGKSKEMIKGALFVLTNSTQRALEGGSFGESTKVLPETEDSRK